MESIKTNYGIVCDEVRREDNGKLIFIGVYGASILVSEIPATLVLWLVVNSEASETKTIEIEFRALSNDKVVRAGKGKMELGQGVNFNVVPGILLTELTEGNLEFQLRCPGDEEWRSLVTVPILRKTS